VQPLPNAGKCAPVPIPGKHATRAKVEKAYIAAKPAGNHAIKYRRESMQLAELICDQLKNFTLYYYYFLSQFYYFNFFYQWEIAPRRPHI